MEDDVEHDWFIFSDKYDNWDCCCLWLLKIAVRSLALSLCCCGQSSNGGKGCGGGRDVSGKASPPFLELTDCASSRCILSNTTDKQTKKGGDNVNNYDFFPSASFLLKKHNNCTPSVFYQPVRLPGKITSLLSLLCRIVVMLSFFLRKKILQRRRVIVLFKSKCSASNMCLNIKNCKRHMQQNLSWRDKINEKRINHLATLFYSQK